MDARFAIVLAAISFAPYCLADTAGTWQPGSGRTQERIWPAAPPDARPSASPEQQGIETKSLVGGKPWTYVSDVSNPTMTIYPPKGENTGAAAVVFPGGGYQVLAIDLEGTEICDWLTSKGIACVLLKYRVPDSGPHHDTRLNRQVVPKVLTALEDAQRTIGLVRHRAKELAIDPHKIGVIGFSAGGHLVVASSTQFERRLYRPIDSADQESCRPDFAIAVYPGHLWTGKGLGIQPYIHVDKRTPPTILIQAENDYTDGVEQSLVYYEALKNAGVPAEMHLFAEGGHAFGLRSGDLPIGRWPELVEAWLKAIDIIPTSERAAR